MTIDGHHSFLFFLNASMNDMTTTSKVIGNKAHNNCDMNSLPRKKLEGETNSSIAIPKLYIKLHQETKYLVILYLNPISGK